MNNFVNTLVERKGELLNDTLQHITISLSALLLAMAIAIPLAILVVHHKKVGEVLLQVTGVLQTIPSLALLGLLIPIVGIGSVPALIALVVYALLPIFQNTYVGLAEIDPAIEEAAVAFGMSRIRRLIKVEIPIALPIIISGIRSALVLIIGTATLAALVGGGGLGNLILLGIDRNNTALTLIGALASALLAIIFSALINLLQKAKPRVTGLVLVALICSIGGYSVYQKQAANQETITIAGKLGAEPDILINMYAQLIEAADPQAHVVLKSNFGKTSFLFNALKSGQIDIYPEFTGTVLDSLVKVPQTVDKSKLTANETYQEANKLLAKQAQLRLLAPMAYQNTYALAVKQTFATKHGLQTISDLQQVLPQIKAGFTLEFIDRADGYKGVKAKYGLTFPSVQGMEPSLRYEAINQNKINLIDAYSTDSELARYGLVVLQDDRQLFPDYRGAPLMSQAFAQKHPQIVAALNQLAGKISAAEMTAMNYQVNVKRKSAASVAQNYLVKHGLLKGDQ